MRDWGSADVQNLFLRSCFSTHYLKSRVSIAVSPSRLSGELSRPKPLLYFAFLEFECTMR